MSDRSWQQRGQGRKHGRMAVKCDVQFDKEQVAEKSDGLFPFLPPFSGSFLSPSF